VLDPVADAGLVEPDGVHIAGRPGRDGIQRPAQASLLVRADIALSSVLIALRGMTDQPAAADAGPAMASPVRPDNIAAAPDSAHRLG